MKHKLSVGFSRKTGKDSMWFLYLRMLKEKEPLYTTQFWLLCMSHALFAGSFNMIIPELPAHLESMGGAEYKGLIISLFTLMAGLSRPFSGRLTDTVGRVSVMVFGSLVCVVCSLLYPLVTGVAGFLWLRFFHGFSTGFKPTASSAFVADIAPYYRRGEAMGILGVSMNLGSSIFPPVGSWLVNAYSIDLMFYVSSGLALLSILILLGMKETLEDRQAFRPGLLKVGWQDFLEPSAVPPAIIIGLSYACFGVLLTVVPDQADYLGMGNKGLFFTSFTAFGLISRLVAGRSSDRFGREPILKISLVLTAVALVFLGYAGSPLMLMVGAGALGFCTGVLGPTAFAWVVDRSDSRYRGRAMATAFIALEIGIGVGALYSAWVYDNTPANFPKVFLASAFLCLVALVYMVWRNRYAAK